MTRTRRSDRTITSRKLRRVSLRFAVPAVLAATTLGVGGLALPAAASTSTPPASERADAEYAYLSGTVTLGAGQTPGTGVTVQLLGADGGLYSFVGTGQDGSFKVSTPKPGKYRIIFYPSTGGPSFPGARYQTQYLGGTPDPSKALVTTVKAGEDLTGLNINLPLSSETPTTISRLEGAERYSTAVSVSRNHWPDSGADAVWIVTGENYPDALSAGPAAIRGHDPLLLTESDNLPAKVKAEIERLGASKVVVVGGPNAVTDSVFSELKAMVPDTIRISGADRYEVSRNVAEFAFADLAKGVSPFIATGTNYPDALTAGAIAGARTSPVVLVDGSKDSLDEATTDLLTELQPTGLFIAGGTNAVSDGISSDLEGIAGTERVAGEDRYDTAALLVQKYQTGVPRYAYLVTGSNFPDALSAAASAGSFVQPLYLSQTDCVPESVKASMLDRGVEWVVLVGGKNALSTSVEQLSVCPPPMVVD
ncbi:cell wall-binding repeat-containing protein [Herbiconiux sp. VKM Ac-2851]|uniref:cell wall-binding repeat-containing protein n=1 Tax=Herbiconiux sp. VKM Ac-2851 TaxID=2739025 RepID=UPI0015674754|nr:cell wall-binding repeat-containing protein [Herbiconiux sp. VKM Ac-2851]NQX36235.1 cell wall-binding repeat-containing protein [Herbiconiux sp. VKM Ac-2851]